ncbi:MAG: hypothetical protein ABEJ90_03205 [Halobacterium sp.]
MLDARAGPGRARAAKFAAAVVAGLGVGTLVPPDPVGLPGIGSVSGLLFGSAGLAAGAVLYSQASRLAPADCGCGGDCDC